MITVFRGTEFVSATIAQMIYTFHQGLEMLARNTGATVTFKTATTAELEAIVWAGGQMYFQVLSEYDDNLGHQFLRVSRGILDGGEFVSKANVIEDYLGGGYEFYPELILINGGDVWDLAFHCSRQFYQQGSDVELHMRSAHLKSSIGGEPYYTGGVFTGPPSGKPFPDYDAVGVQSDNLSILHTKHSYGGKNVPEQRAMAFPALLGFGVELELGAPTINSRVVYDLYGTSVPAYTEFSIGTAAFISLGGVAIRST